MSLRVTKECFAPTSQCANCMRKYRVNITEKNDRGHLKRCSDCHLMTYCDRDCQKEHWNAVHKRHCKFLSGKQIVANSKHDKESCTWCVKATRRENSDINSPKTYCHIQSIINGMKIKLSCLFFFHKEGKATSLVGENSCGCSVEYACNLPFSLGEVSGEYIGSGMDEMVAHAISLVHAMCFKNESETVNKSLNDLLEYRGLIWRKHLIYGTAERPFLAEQSEMLPEIIDDLEKCFGSSSVWWKAVKFTIDIVTHIDRLMHFNNLNLKDLEDPRFQNLKKLYQYEDPQIRNVLRVTQNKMWKNFKLWPRLSGGRLVLHLPDGVRCDSCNVELKGRFTDTSSQPSTLPDLMTTVGNNGGMVAVCSMETNLTCPAIYVSKNPKLGLIINENLCKLIDEEWASFLVKSRGCDICLTNSLTSHRCSSCLAAQYCSTQCQKKDLNFHKTVCAAWAKDENRKIISSSQQKKVFKSLVCKKN